MGPSPHSGAVRDQHLEYQRRLGRSQLSKVMHPLPRIGGSPGGWSWCWPVEGRPSRCAARSSLSSVTDPFERTWRVWHEFQQPTPHCPGRGLNYVAPTGGGIVPRLVLRDSGPVDSDCPTYFPLHSIWGPIYDLNNFWAYRATAFLTAVVGIPCSLSIAENSR